MENNTFPTCPQCNGGEIDTIFEKDRPTKSFCKKCGFKWQPTFSKPELNTKAINAALLAMTQSERDEVMDKILEGMCSYCYSNLGEGEICWSCYQSPLDYD